MKCISGCSPQLLLVLAVCWIGMYCSLTAGLTAVDNMYWPTGGGAKCVNLTEVESLYPGVTIPPVCYNFIIWDKVYVDNNTLVRNVLGRVSMGAWSLPDCLNVEYRYWCTLMFRYRFHPTVVFNLTTASQCLLRAATFFVNYLIKFLRSSKTPNTCAN